MKEHYNQNGLQGISQLKVQPETTEFEMTGSGYHSKKCQRMIAREQKNHYINLDVHFIPYLSITLLGAPGSRPGRVAVRFGLEQVTF